MGVLLVSDKDEKEALKKAKELIQKIKLL